LVPDLGRVAVAVSILVRPRRFAGDVVAVKGVRIRREKRCHLAADSRVEIVLGDERDDLVTFVAPSERGTWARHCDDEKSPGKEKRLWGSSAHVAPGDEIGGPVLARRRTP
jgi:hypothetical protein